MVSWFSTPPPKRFNPCHFFAILTFLAIFVATFGGVLVVGCGGQCQAWLVESVPTDLPQLPRIPGLLSTSEVFQWLAGNSSSGLDLLVQYWQLVAHPENPLSGDYGYTVEEMERFGAPSGQAVYHSLEKAADRGVPIRIIQHSGVYPDYTEESAALAAGRSNVQNRTLLLKDWWGSGIEHAKVWISNKKDIYIGSANNDWKSLTQVKELGIYLVDCPKVAKKLEVYFGNLWTLTSLNSSLYTKIAWDNKFQTSRKVPCWSHFLQPDERCRSPLPKAMDTPGVLGYPLIESPDLLEFDLLTPGSAAADSSCDPSYLSFSPPELSFQRYQSDEQGWVDTILSAKYNGSVRISTMDWLGQSLYLNPNIFWASLTSAISEVVFSKNVMVKLLVAHWAHDIQGTADYLRYLNSMNVLCVATRGRKCTGEVSVKLFAVPGFNSTGPKIADGKATGNLYPGYSRVVHAKYAVSDIRAHIGTSNLVWDYFYTTAGVSFGSYNKALVRQLQEVFDADWDSPYATELPRWKFDA